jgi:hypothetical protein
VIRHRVDPGDVPAEKAARRLHLTVEEFRQKLPDLLARGFPVPDPTTGNFDLDAIDVWRRSRNPHLFPQATQARLIPGPTARDANDVVASRLARARGG